MSFAATAVAGIALIIALSIRGFDRSIMLVPTWALILVWTIGGWMVVTGQLDNDIVQPALTGGLILIVLLIGFTVMQHAFAGGALQQGLFSDIERQALAILGSGDTVWDWDVPRDRVTTRPDVAALLGPSANALGGAARNWLPFLHPEDRDRFRMSLDTLLEHRRGRIAQSFRLRGDDGHYRWFQLRARPVIGSDGEIIRCVGTLADVTEQKKSEERLLHDAVHDNLTGLPNRELFIERLNSVLSLAPISPTIRPSVFVVNLDRFSHVNDGLGISAGDTILLSVARRLHRLLGPQDAMSRLSGDQFCLMVLATDDPAHIAAMADAIRTAIRAPITFAKREIVLTASIGLVAWNQNIIGGEDLIKDAELAMFQAKRLGGDRIEPFRPAFRNVSSGRIQLESDLHRAIEREEIKLVYQPIIALADGSVAGFEALMRWVHPRKGLIGPSEFIPVAERSGLIAQLGLFAMREAATTLAGWMQSPDAPRAFVSVNISSRQLLREDLVADVRSCLQRANLAPELFKLELTETMVMANPEQAAHVLSRLRALGIGLSLDDFGTGYSSLAYLARFAFDTLKIDRTFTSGNTEQTRTLLRSIVTLANDLGLKTVAEGVENDETARQLSELNCTYVQSFAFGEPMDADAALRLLKQQPQARKAS
jgi:diguanylate cyclase (GGDEF)-like protein/PAS domain S-box-containing protein